MKKFLFAFLLSALASVALAADYIGYNPTTGLNTQPGTLVSPTSSSGVVLGSSTSCGTVAASTLGASAGSVTAAATTCTIQLVFPATAPNGFVCIFKDLTHPSDAINQAASTTTSCTSTAATVSSSDVILYFAIAY